MTYSICFGSEDLVAEDLESRFGIIQGFIDKNMDGVINDFIRERFNDSSHNDTSTITEALKQHITSRRTGFVTNASIIGTTRERVGKLGRGKLLKNRPNRPSFIESGVYVDNLEVWIDDSE